MSRILDTWWITTGQLRSRFRLKSFVDNSLTKVNTTARPLRYHLVQKDPTPGGLDWFFWRQNLNFLEECDHGKRRS